MIGVVGLGYVGLPLAVALARSGAPVMGLDHDQERISSLYTGDSPFGDLENQEITEALAAGLTPTTEVGDLSECNSFIICTPTPLGTGGQPDTRQITLAVEAISPFVKPGCLVVLESTSYPGSTLELVAKPLEALTGMVAGEDFCVAFSPERIDPGNKLFSIVNTPKIVAGLKQCCMEKAVSLYSNVCTEIVPTRGLMEAELSKLLENTYRQVNIALVNELAQASQAMGIDLREAIRLAATKPFGFEAFYPGPGVGGHCIPIDPMYLASAVKSTVGMDLHLVELAQRINNSMPEWVVKRLEDVLRARGVELLGSDIVLLGVAYKRDVEDTRETPALEIARMLKSKGAKVTYIDPHVSQWIVDAERIQQFRGQAQATASILLTDHSIFSRMDIKKVAPLCLDTRGALTGDYVVAM